MLATDFYPPIVPVLPKAKDLSFKCKHIPRARRSFFHSPIVPSPTLFPNTHCIIAGQWRMPMPTQPTGFHHWKFLACSWHCMLLNIIK